MPRSCLPTYPFILFGIIEPALLVWAYAVGMSNPLRFFADQAPNHAVTPTSLSPQAEALTLQMLNVLLLLAPMALICCWTDHAATTKCYLIALALADLGHVYATYRGVGHDYFVRPGGWNDMVWGNVGVSLCLHVSRLLTVMGVFGEVGRDGEGEQVTRK